MEKEKNDQMINTDLSVLPTGYITDLYKRVLMAVKASNSIALDETEYHYYAKFPEFQEKVNDLLKKIHSIIQNLMIKNDNDITSRSDAGGVFDESFVMKTANFVDKLIDDAQEQIDFVQTGKKREKISKSETNTVDSNNAIKVNNDVKPQLYFKDIIDNSESSFVCKLKKKYYTTSLKDYSTENIITSEHPYDHEIGILNYQETLERVRSIDGCALPSMSSPCTWVDTVEGLNLVLKKLCDKNCLEFALDLENHSFRSFQGFLCLMQISTYQEDFLIDTIVLRSELHILNQVFTDPKKLKILHGSDSDIVWLQRDLGLYIVNMFDTGQAARVLEYPGFSLAYLLKLHCAVEADKQYQTADWRIRPLSKEMIYYARQDTRYLLYIFQRMRVELDKKSKDISNDLLLQVLKKSNQICLQLYEKPKWDLKSCEQLILKMKTKFSQHQKNIFIAVHKWRDVIARREDESLGYVMSNLLLVRIAKVIPSSYTELMGCSKMISSMVMKYADELIKLINNVEIEQNTTSSLNDSTTSFISSTSIISNNNLSSSLSSKNTTPIPSDRLKNYKGWKILTKFNLSSSVKDKLEEVDVDVGSLFSSIKQDINTLKSCSKDLNEIKRSWESTVFHIASVSNEKRKDRPKQCMKRDLQAVEETTIEEPKSISQMYKMPNVDKKRKISKSIINLQDEDNDDAPQDAVEKIEKLKPISTEEINDFDYETEAQKLILSTEAKSKSFHSKQRRSKGYNPFIKS